MIIEEMLKAYTTINNIYINDIFIFYQSNPKSS